MRIDDSCRGYSFFSYKLLTSQFHSGHSKTLFPPVVLLPSHPYIYDKKIAYNTINSRTELLLCKQVRFHDKEHYPEPLVICISRPNPWYIPPCHGAIFITALCNVLWMLCIADRVNYICFCFRYYVLCVARYDLLPH